MGTVAQVVGSVLWSFGYGLLHLLRFYLILISVPNLINTLGLFVMSVVRSDFVFLSLDVGILVTRRRQARGVVRACCWARACG